MNDVLISYLDRSVLQADRISTELTADTWQVIPYEAGDVKGNLLLSGEMSASPEVTLHLGLSGWYKIFVATVNFRSQNYFALRLKSDAGFTGMRSPSCGSTHHWSRVECFQEFFWKAARLDGEDLILRKPNAYFSNAAALAWIRCVPMTVEEISAEGAKGCMRIHTHIDEEPNFEDDVDCDEGLLTRVYPITKGDVTDCSLEISFDYDVPEYESALRAKSSELGREKKDEAFYKVRERAYRVRIDELHSKGIKAYATNRMSVAAFTLPYGNSRWTRRTFVEEHPELYCKTRDGRTLPVCSYAFKETREFVLDTLTSYMKYGFDGVSLIFHRGLHIHFEEPVISRFSELYPGVDARRVPASDPRLHGVWCDMMTEFMVELRKRLGNLTINVITEYSPKTAKHFGIDVEGWAKAGLIDGVYQGIMETVERLDGCMADDGLIDLSLYESKLKREPILSRYHTTDIEKTLDGAREYLDVLKGTDVTFAATLPWSHSHSPEGCIEWKEKVAALGIRDLLCWNTNHLMYDLPELYSVIYSADALTEEKYTQKSYRTLSLAGSDISTFDVNWRG